MKRWLLLGITLCVIWLLWSGHFEHGFLLLLGLASVATVVLLAIRMGIADDEGASLGWGLASWVYALWLGREIVIANIEVVKLILDPKLPIRPRMIRVAVKQKTELGRVILANSITLTPGTVSVDLQPDHVWVHALSYAEAEEDLSGDMGRRVCALER